MGGRDPSTWAITCEHSCCAFADPQSYLQSRVSELDTDCGHIQSLQGLSFLYKLCLLPFCVFYFDLRMLRHFSFLSVWSAACLIEFPLNKLRWDSVKSWWGWCGGDCEKRKCSMSKASLDFISDVAVFQLHCRAHEMYEGCTLRELWFSH